MDDDYDDDDDGPTLDESRGRVTPFDAVLGVVPASLSPQFDDAFNERFEVQELLGEGGFGLVYTGIQRSTGQKVAIKVLRKDAAQSIQKELARFEREMKLQARLKHPNIVRLIDASSTGNVYIVLEFVEGESLHALIAREGALPEREARRLMLQVMDALCCAHEEGVVHRDLKPHNIMITTTGGRKNALVLDFGISALVDYARDLDYHTITEQGSFIGTPAYMAPEQLHHSSALTPASDIYSWGLVFLECLMGHRALDETNTPALIFKQMSDEPINIPPEVAQLPVGKVIRRAIHKSLSRRFANAQEALEALIAIEDESNSFVYEVVSDPDDVQLPTRPPTVPIVLAVLLLTTGLVLFLLMRNADTEPTQSLQDTETTNASSKTAPLPQEPSDPAEEVEPPPPPKAPFLVPTVLMAAGPSQIGVTEDELLELIKLYPELGFELSVDSGLYPAQNLKRPALHVMNHEVSWKDWEKHAPPGRDVPCGPRPKVEHITNAVHHVGAAEADAFCRHLGMRLPTAQEWEMLARGISSDTIDGVTRPKSTDPLKRMIGGVSEWVTCGKGSRASCGETGFAHRGGSWKSALSSAGWEHPPLLGLLLANPDCLRDEAIGFRCVQDVKP